MQFNTPARTTAAPRPARRATRRQRGSVLLLVVVSIVLMTVMGATYLQVARVDRFSTEQIEFESGDIDAVVAASLRQIRTALKDDVLEIDSSGDAWFLSRNDEDLDNLLDESYDYAWTNLTTPGSLDDMWLATTTPRFHEDNPGSGSYGSTTGYDPNWRHLTSLLDPITFGTGDEEYIVLPAQGGGETTPGLYSVELTTGTTLADLAPLNTNVSILGTTGSDLSREISANWERLGADADRDGVPDARWMYAPVRRIGTTEYVMAARIIDNSSLLNLNAATFLTNGLPGDDAFDGGTSNRNARSPRGYVPSDFDLARLASRVLDEDGSGYLSASALSAPVLTVLDNWMTTRGLNDQNVDGDLYWLGLTSQLTPSYTNPELNPANLPRGLNDQTTNPFFDPDGRLAAYFDDVRGTIDYGATTGKYGAADEIELRWGGGVNGSGVETAIETDLDEVLRRRDGNNAYDADIDPVANALGIRAIDIAEEGIGTLSDEAALAHYFQGGLDDDASVGPFADRQFPAIRQLLTTYNGVDNLIPNIDGQSQSSTTANDPETKFSLLFGEYDWNANTFSYTSLRNELAQPTNGADPGILPEIFRLEALPGTVADRYLGTTTDDDADVYAASLAAGIVDAVDREPAGTPEQPSFVVSNTGIRYWGTERLPYLREAFVQVGYRNENLQPDPNTSLPDALFETWTLVADSEAIAVEIGNPFERSMDLDAMDLRLRITQGGTSVDYPLNALGITIEPAADIDPSSDEFDDQVILYRNPTVSVTEGSEGTNLLTDLGLDTDAVADYAIGGNRPFDASSSDNIEIELQVNTDSGYVTYDRFVFSWAGLSDEVHPDQNVTDYPGEIPAAQFDSHVISTVARDGRGLYYLTNFSNISSGGFSNANPSQVILSDPIRNNTDIGTPTYNLTSPGSTDTIESLGDDNKNVAGTILNAVEGMDIASSLTPGTNRLEDVYTNRFKLSISDHPFLSVSDIASVFMLGFTTDGSNDLVNSTPTRITNTLRSHPEATVGGVTYPEWHRYAYLDISPDATSVDVDSVNIGNQGLPHAALVFDRLAVIDPMNDDRDNDADDDTDESPTQVTDIEERLIPGVMNINTTPAFLAALAAPLPEDLDDAEGLFRAIAGYRDYPDTRTTANGYPSNLPSSPALTTGTPNPDYRPGIASIGELLFINDDATNVAGYRASANVAENTVMQTVGRDADLADSVAGFADTDAMNYGRISGSVTGTPQSHDRYHISPIPEVEEYIRTTLNETYRRYGAIDGPEERLARFQFLANLFSTRSDVYTAYVVIRGYQSGAYQLGPTEQAHYIAVFDRSGLRDANTPVRLVAFERVQ
ncbi:MAG: hypothetical protein AAGI54_12675 [Planctomycetota bacterium]